MCLKCSTIIMSSRSGEWVSCECSSIYCDQTTHYARYGGNPNDMFTFVMPQDVGVGEYHEDEETQE